MGKVRPIPRAIGSVRIGHSCQTPAFPALGLRSSSSSMDRVTDFESEGCRFESCPGVMFTDRYTSKRPGGPRRMATPNQIRQAVRAQPFVPFVIHLADGGRSRSSTPSSWRSRRMAASCPSWPMTGTSTRSRCCWLPRSKLRRRKGTNPGKGEGRTKEPDRRLEGDLICRRPVLLT